MNTLLSGIQTSLFSQPWAWLLTYLTCYFLGALLVKTTLAKGLRLLTPTSWGPFIQRFRNPGVFLVLLPALWMSVNRLQLEGPLLSFSQSILKAIFYTCIFWCLFSATFFLFSGFRAIAARTSSKLDDQLIPILEKIVRFAILSLGFLLILQSFGLDVFSLIAGLGLGGLALALAAKDTASNFFGSLMILLDQPFNIGDWVKVDNSEGTVEDIGLRSTRIRTFYNSVVVVPNSTVAMSTLDNLGKREYRRFRHIIGLEYGVPRENIQNFMEALKKWISENPKTVNDKTEVRLNALGAHSVDILVYVFFAVKDWAEELEEREKLIFEILQLSSQCQAPIAFPTQTLHLSSTDSGTP